MAAGRSSGDSRDEALGRDEAQDKEDVSASSSIRVYRVGVPKNSISPSVSEVLADPDRYQDEYRRLAATTSSTMATVADQYRRILGPTLEGLRKALAMQTSALKPTSADAFKTFEIPGAAAFLKEFSSQMDSMLKAAAITPLPRVDVARTFGVTPSRVSQIAKAASESHYSSHLIPDVAVDSVTSVQPLESAAGVVTDLERLASLYERELLTKGEFVKAKQRLLELDQ